MPESLNASQDLSGSVPFPYALRMKPEDHCIKFEERRNRRSSCWTAFLNTSLIRTVLFYLHTEVHLKLFCFSTVSEFPFGHHPDDLDIRLFHADSAEAGEVSDGLFDAFFHQAVPAVELLAGTVHFKAEDTGIDGSRNFRRTG